MRFKIPNGWRKKKLTEIADVQTGIAKGKKNISDPVDLPYLRVANVQDGHLDLSEIKTIEVSRHEIERFSLRKGDVLFTEGGDFDKLGRGTVWQDEIPRCLHQNHVFSVRVHADEMLPYFLATYASSFWGRTYFRSCSKQTTNLASINSTQLKAMPLPVPPLPEQQKIAAILSTWDRAIELTEKLIAAKQKRKQALMQQLLTGKVSVSAIANSTTSKRTAPSPTTDTGVSDVAATVLRERYTPTDIGPSPLHWGAPFLADVSSLITNGFVGTATPHYTDETGVRYLYGTNVRANRINLKGLRYVNHAFDEKESKTRLRAGDLLTVQSGHIGTTAVVPMELEGANCHALIVTRLDKAKIDPHFISQYLNSEIGIARMRGLEVGSTILHINTKDLKRFRIPLPPLPEQQKIASILLNSDREIEVLHCKVKLLVSQKKGLMQQLLTGKVRVKVDAETEQV